MSKKLTVILVVALTFIASGSVFAQQAAELNNPVPLGEKPEAPKYSPQRAGNPFFGRPNIDLEGPLSEGFESGAIPANWTVYNEDGDSYQWEAYSTTSAHSGNYVARVHYNYTYPGCDDWLITPRLTCGTSETFTFWAKSYSSYYLEDFEVRVSTSGNAVGDFTNLELTVIGQPYDWTEYNIDLSAYDGMDIYVAVRCISYDEFYLYVDDFSGPELWVPEGPVAEFNTSTLDFGLVTVGMSADLPLVIYSAGSEALTVSNVVSDNAHFTHDFPGTTVIPPGDSLVVTVTFTPTAAPEETGTLTVTHDGTKAENYISMSGSGWTGLFFEDFEASFPPPGWAHYFMGDIYYGWVWASGGAPDFTGYCAAHFDDYANCNNWLVTPPITIPAGKYHAQLEYWNYEYYSSWMGYHGIWVSIGSGDPNDGDFVEVAAPGPSTDGAWEEAPIIDLGAFTGETIYIAFVYQGFFADWWGIDDVAVNEYVNQPPEIAHDPKGDTDDTTPTLTAIITDVESFTATAYYETASKVFSSVAMAPTGVLPNEYSIDLPALPYGTVNYYIEADDGIGGVATTDIYSFEIQEFEGQEFFYDDGTVENAHCWNPGYTNGRWAVRFTSDAYPCTVSAVKLGIIHGWPDDAHQQFAVEIYDDDGPGGAPGTLIYGPDTTGSVGNVVGGLPPLYGPPYPLNWAYVCIKDEVVITSGDFYVAKVQFEGYPDCEGLEEDETGGFGRSWELDPTYLTWSQMTDANSMIRAYLRFIPPKIHLTDGQVDPMIGDLCTDFTYSVTYTHDEDLPPTVQDVYIDGIAHAMTDPTGGAGPYTDGVVFTYEHHFDMGGDHEFYFYFEDGIEIARLPAADAFQGPMNGYYFYDFEDAAQFTPTGPNDAWQWGGPTYGPASAHSGANCWGTNLSGDYSTYSASRLETPHLDFTTGGGTKLELKFWHWYDIESYYDGGNVKLFTPTDTVIVYPDITQCPDYDEDSFSSANAWVPYQPGYCGHYQKQWEEAIFDLTPWTNESDVVIAFDFGSDGSVQYPGWYIDDVVIWGDPPLALEVAFDVKPTSCPNPLNVNNNGVLPVAILGTEDFDVSQVDPERVFLEGLPPVNWSFEDVATPVAPGGEECDCTTQGSDGYMDLTLKFKNQEVSEQLWPVTHGEVRVLTLRGIANGCMPIQGQDCVRIIYNKPHDKRPFVDRFKPVPFTCVGSYPNPFNSETNISFGLPERTQVSLVIYNVLGEKVKTLVAGELGAGEHIVNWDGRDEAGSLVASGIYFYRFKTENFTKTMKLMLIK